MLLGEAKWHREVEAPALRRDLERGATLLPRTAEQLRYAIAARERVRDADGVLAVTAADVFA